MKIPERIKKLERFAPMLAAKDLPEQIRWPVLVSPKIDGIRAIIKDGVVLSRSLKPIPNAYVQELLGSPAYEGLDGELVVGDPTDKNVMQKTTSGVMSKSGQPDVSYLVFDYWKRPLEKFRNRLSIAAGFLDSVRTCLVPHTEVETMAELVRFEATCLAEGYEGVMLRDPRGKYKFGRSTSSEGGLIKLKRYEDAEAVIVGVNEMMHNGNVAEQDNFGRVKRSSAKAGMKSKGCMGELVCELQSLDLSIEPGTQFNIGTGFSQVQREWFWTHRESVIGQLVKFKHFAQTGVVDKPRNPVFIGLRHKEDM